MDVFLFYFGAVLIFLWGLAHNIPTRRILADYGPISVESKRIATAGWIAESLILCFIGILVFLVTLLGGAEIVTPMTVYICCAVMLLAMAVLSLFTTARNPVVPMKLCPLVKTVAALCFITGLFF
jgi:hypothetical protein